MIISRLRSSTLAFSPSAMALTALVLYLLMVLNVLGGRDWDPLAFVLPRPQDAPLEQTWAIGYDGQHAYAIAQDPLNPPGWIDHPAFRYMRILYPVLAGMLALEMDGLIPWSMLLINLAATGISTYYLADLLEQKGAPIWPALIFPLSFNFLIGVRFDLNEPLAFALVLFGLRQFSRGRLPSAVVAFALAGLTKEIALAFPLGLAVFLLFQRNPRASLALAGGSLIPYFTWALLVSLWHQASPYYRGLAPSSLIPFAGFFEVGQPESRVIILLWALAPALMLGIYSAWRILRSRFRTTGPEPFLALANVGILGAIPVLTWVDPLAVLRTALGAQLSLLLIAPSIDRRLFPFLAALWCPSLLLALLIPGFVL